MFLLWKNILLIPVWLLCEIGTPFKWDNNGSSLRNLSEYALKEKYNSARFNHYLGRIVMSAAFIIGCMIFLSLVVLSNGAILWIFPIVTVIVLSIDGFMMFCRFIYYREEEKKAESRNELVVVDAWKDTSLNGLLKQRAEARQKFRDEYFARTGREPDPYSY